MNTFPVEQIIVATAVSDPPNADVTCGSVDIGWLVHTFLVTGER